MYITPITKLGELGSELVFNCILMLKTGVHIKDTIKTCCFPEGSRKKNPSYVNQKLQIVSPNDIMQVLGLVKLQIFC